MMDAILERLSRLEAENAALKKALENKGAANNNARTTVSEALSPTRKGPPSRTGFGTAGTGRSGSEVPLRSFASPTTSSTQKASSSSSAHNVSPRRLATPDGAGMATDLLRSPASSSNVVAASAQSSRRPESSGEKAAGERGAVLSTRVDDPPPDYESAAAHLHDPDRLKLEAALVQLEKLLSRQRRKDEEKDDIGASTRRRARRGRDDNRDSGNEGSDEEFTGERRRRSSRRGARGRTISSSSSSTSSSPSAKPRLRRDDREETPPKENHEEGRKRNRKSNPRKGHSKGRDGRRSKSRTASSREQVKAATTQAAFPLPNRSQLYPAAPCSSPSPSPSSVFNAAVSDVPPAAARLFSDMQAFAKEVEQGPPAPQGQGRGTGQHFYTRPLFSIRDAVVEATSSSSSSFFSSSSSSLAHAVAADSTSLLAPTAPLFGSGASFPPASASLTHSSASAFSRQLLGLSLPCSSPPVVGSPTGATSSNAAATASSPEPPHSLSQSLPPFTASAASAYSFPSVDPRVSSFSFPSADSALPALYSYALLSLPVTTPSAAAALPQEDNEHEEPAALERRNGITKRTAAEHRDATQTLMPAMPPMPPLSSLFSGVALSAGPHGNGAASTFRFNASPGAAAANMDGNAFVDLAQGGAELRGSRQQQQRQVEQVKQQQPQQAVHSSLSAASTIDSARARLGGRGGGDGTAFDLFSPLSSSHIGSAPADVPDDPSETALFWALRGL